MSSSTVSLPSNSATAVATTTTTATRRQKSTPTIDPPNDAIPSTPNPNPNPNATTTPRIETRDRNAAVAKKAKYRAGNLGRKPNRPVKSKWVMIGRVLSRNLLVLVVLAGLVQIVRRLMERGSLGGDGASGEGRDLRDGDWEGRFAEMDRFVQKTSKMIQVQVDVIDRKLDRHVESVREELGKRDKGVEERLREVRRSLEKEFGERVGGLLSKKEFEAFVGEYLKGRGRKDGVSLDDVRGYAREVVEREIEKHAADGLGRVDYALAAGGSRVVKHSEVYVRRMGVALNSMLGRSSVSVDAEKMFTPSFGEPGKCFALKGSSGYVTVRLRTAIVVEAITLEHVEKSVAYDRSSAPKDCRISGWLAQAEDLTDATAENEKMVLLSEFTYDLGQRNTQTFKVLDSVGSSLVDTIRFDFISNHGSLSHTCIYRLRVHGYEPSISVSAAEP